MAASLKIKIYQNFTLYLSGISAAEKMRLWNFALLLKSETMRMLQMHNASATVC